MKNIFKDPNKLKALEWTLIILGLYNEFLMWFPH